MFLVSVHKINLDLEIGTDLRFQDKGSRSIRRKKIQIGSTNKLSIKINIQNHCFLIY